MLEMLWLLNMSLQEQLTVLLCRETMPICLEFIPEVLSFRLIFLRAVHRLKNNIMKFLKNQLFQKRYTVFLGTLSLPIMVTLFLLKKQL